jgi:CRP-like cAMP-binding protein
VPPLAHAGRKALLFPKKHTIFAQGDSADAIFYLQTGKVRLAVVSKAGKDATIGILSEGSFFGEGSLAGQALRMGAAIAMTDCAVLRIEKKAMMQALHRVFMNRFRKLGFRHYAGGVEGGLQVHSSLLNVLLHD